MKPFTILVLLLLASNSFADTTPELIAKLKSPEAKVRRLAAEQLGKAKAAEAIPALGELLKDADNTVNEAARDALRKMGPAAAKSLLGQLKTAEEAEKLMLLDILREMQPDAKDSLPALKEALKDNSSKVRIYAAAVLGNLSGDKGLAIPILREGGKDTSNIGSVKLPGLASSVCVEAIRSVKKIDLDSLEYLADDVLADLTKALKSKNDDIFSAACAGLFELSYFAEPAKKELLEAKERAKDPWENLLIERLLLIFESEELDRKKDEASIKQRIENLRFLAISEPSPELIVHKLRTAFEHDDVRIRYSGFQSLYYLKESAEPAIPAILAMLSDQELATYGIEQQGYGFEMVYIYVARVGYKIVPGLVKIVQGKTNGRPARLQGICALVQLRYGLKKYRNDFEVLMSDFDSLIATQAVTLYVTNGGQIEKALPILERYLKEEWRFTVIGALETINKIGNGASPLIPQLESLLKHSDMEIRINSLRALGAMGEAAKTSIPKMLDLLKSTEPREQLHVLKSLSELNKTALTALPILLKRLPESPAEQKQATLQIIKAIGPEAKDAAPILIKMLQTKNASEYSAVAEALGTIGAEAKVAVPKLIEGLENPNITIRTSAARTLGRMGSNAKEALLPLQKMQKSKDISDRIWSGFALAKITDEYSTYIKEMSELWKASTQRPKKDIERPILKAAATQDIARAFALLGPHSSSARDLFFDIYFSQDLRFIPKDYFAQAFAGNNDTVEVIVSKLTSKLLAPDTHPYWHIDDSRPDVLFALQLIGPRAKSAIPAIRPLLESNSGEVTEAAFKALQRIEGK